jgi:hypothetical protein
VTSDKLFEAFETEIAKSSLDVKFSPSFTAAYKTWVEQKGVPIIHVSTDDTNNKFIVKQSRYYDATETKDEADTRLWHIPLNFVTELDPNFNFDMDNKAFTHFMTTKQMDFSYPGGFKSSDKWFIFNKRQIGYYRVNYDDANWAKLISVLNSDDFEKIDVMNRAQLVDDAMTLAFDGYLSYGIALHILGYLERETDYMPWRAAYNHLDKMDFMLKGTPAHEQFKRFIRKALSNMNKRYALEDSESRTGLIEQFAAEYVIDWNCRFGDVDCLIKTNTLLKFLAIGETTQHSLDIAIMCNGLRRKGSHNEFAALYTHMQKSNDQSERLRIIDGLLCSADRDALESLLHTTMGFTNEHEYRDHERQRILANIFTRSEIGMDVMIDFIPNFFDELSRTFSKGAVQSTILSMSRRITSDADKVKFQRMLTLLRTKIDANTVTEANKNIAFNDGFRMSDKFTKISNVLTSLNKPEFEIENRLRLPKTSEPTYYKLHLDARNVQTGGLDFMGDVQINIKIREQTDVIFMHSRNQQIQEYSVKTKTNEDIEVVNISLYPETDILAIYFQEKLMKDAEIVVHIKYAGTLLTSSSGFYQTSYTHEGQLRYMAATQFQPTRARQAFPNYDEPEFKAIFEVSITHNNSARAIANGKEIDIKEYVVIRFLIYKNSQ